MALVRLVVEGGPGVRMTVALNPAHIASVVATQGAQGHEGARVSLGNGHAFTAVGSFDAITAQIDAELDGQLFTMEPRT